MLPTVEHVEVTPKNMITAKKKAPSDITQFLSSQETNRR